MKYLIKLLIAVQLVFVCPRVICSQQEVKPQQIEVIYVTRVTPEMVPVFIESLKGKPAKISRTRRFSLEEGCGMDALIAAVKDSSESLDEKK